MPVLNQLISATKVYSDMGIALVSCCGKAPYEPGWREGKCSDKQHIISQLIAGKATAIGFICGRINGGIVAIDFDSPAAEACWVEEHRKRDLDPHHYPTVLTPRPGKHRYMLDVRGTLGNSRGKLKGLGIDPRDRGQSLLPPPPCANSGRQSWESGRNFADLQAIANLPD